MLRRFLFLALLVLPFSANADYIVRSLEVRNTINPVFDQKVIASSSGANLEFQFAIITDALESTVAHTVSLSLPMGMRAVSYTVDANADCSAPGVTPNTFSQSNTHFSYRFTPNGSVCETVVTARYNTAGMSNGSYTLSPTITVGSNVRTFENTATLTVDSKWALLRAKTLDTNHNGFIDAYELLFQNPIVTPFPYGTSSVLVDTTSLAGTSFSSTPGSFTGQLSFQDGILGTGKIPSITLPSTSNYLGGTYYVGVAEDTAPIVLTGTVVPGVYHSPITAGFSAISETGSIYISTGASVSTSSSLYSSPFAINSNTTFLTLSKDLAGNTYTQSFAYTFSCSASAPANGTIGAYPGCAISCNSGYHLSGGSCVSNGCTNTAPEHGSLYPYPSCAVSCDLGYHLSGGSCVSDGGGGSTGGSSSGGGGGVYYPPTPTKTGSVISITGPWVIGIGSWVTIGGGDDGIGSRSGSTGSVSDANLYIYKVRGVAKNGLVIYRTKFTPLAKILLAFEKKYITKFNRLLALKRISATQYRTTIGSYNTYILYLSKYRIAGVNVAVKKIATDAFNAFSKIYRKSIIISPSN